MIILKLLILSKLKIHVSQISLKEATNNYSPKMIYLIAFPWKHSLDAPVSSCTLVFIPNK